MKKYIIILFLASTMFSSSCSKDYLETSSSVGVSNSVALGTLENIELAMKGVYINIGNKYYSNQFFGLSYFNIFNDMSASSMTLDRIFLWNVEWAFDTQRQNNLNGNIAKLPWSYLYNIILRANDIITGIKAIEVTENNKALHGDLLGQALTVRAMMYSYLNLYYSPRYVDAATAKTLYSVPIRRDVTTTEIRRATQEEMVIFILGDLDEAIASFSNSTSIVREAEYMSGNAAKLLKLRLLMYIGNNKDVLILAQDIIATSGKSIMGASAYKSGFNSVKNTEWIYGSVISADSGITWTYTGVWLNYDCTQWGAIYGPSLMDMGYVFGTDASDIKLVSDGDGVADQFEGTPPTTKGLTMRSTDIRRSLFLEDDEKTILDNGYPHYYNEGWTGWSGSYVNQGQCRKFSDKNVDRIADVVFMRLAEVYYIAAEAAVLTGDDGQAQTYLAAVTEPYDAGATAFIKSKTGADLEVLIENYKRVDMFGEGTVFADVKRRGDWVYRFSKYNPIKTMVNGQYKSTSPYLPQRVLSGDIEVYLKDFTTIPIPQAALEGNSLLEQNK